MHVVKFSSPLFYQILTKLAVTSVADSISLYASLKAVPARPELRGSFAFTPVCEASS